MFLYRIYLHKIPFYEINHTCLQITFSYVTEEEVFKVQAVKQYSFLLQ